MMTGFVVTDVYIECRNGSDIVEKLPRRGRSRVFQTKEEVKAYKERIRAKQRERIKKEHPEFDNPVINIHFVVLSLFTEGYRENVPCKI